MPTTSSVVKSIRKPFTANKRFFGLLTVAFIIIGLLGAGYYSHTKTNEHNFRESKLQSLDSHFDIISRQLNNDFQKHYSKIKIGKDSVSASQKLKIPILPADIKDSIWEDLKNSKKPLLFAYEFDKYVIIFKDQKDPKKIINRSSLKGKVNLPDTLLRENPFNIGVSLGIPKEDNEYQLFSREYNYSTELDSNVAFDITIIGLIDSDSYNKHVRRLDSWIIALLTTFLLLSIFGLPYFKLLFIAEDERVSSKDVILSCISVIVGAPILIIVFLSLMHHYYDYYEIIPDRLEQLSKEIGDRFERENKQNAELLQTATGYSSGKILNTNAEDVPNIKIQEKDTSLLQNFKFITKIDASGEVLYHVSAIDNPEIEKVNNLKNRVYFSHFVADSNVWQSERNIDYVMRPVVSIEDQTEEAIYVIEDTEDVSCLVVGSSQLKSVHNPILPFGYQFAIVDDTGEVWFHSEEGRATLENFFTVSRQFSNLKAAILGRISANGLVNYRQESKLFNVSPVKGTNLSVIALYDIGLLRTRVSEVLTLSSMAIVLAFLMMLLTTILSLIIRNPKLGLYKYNTFPFEFLTPKKDKRETYILLSSLFLGVLLIAITAGTLYVIEPPKVYIICLLFSMWAYLTVYYTLHPYRNKGDIKFRVRDMLIVLVIVVLNILMIVISPEELGFPLVVILIQLSCVCIVIYNQLSEKLKARIPFRRQFHLLAKRIGNIVKFNRFKIHIAYRYWYSIFLFSWLLLAAVFPAYLVFEKAQDINDLIWYKTDQIHMAQAYMEKEKNLRENLPLFEDLEEKHPDIHKNHLEEALYPESVHITRQPDNLVLGSVDNNTIFEEFLWKTRPVYDERVREFQSLIYQHSKDASWTSEEDLKNLSLTLNDLAKKGSVLVTGHKAKNFMNINLGFPILKLVGILLILPILFSLILFFVDRFYAFRFRHLRPNDFDTDNDKDYVKKFGHMLLAEKSNSGLLLVGLPFSGKRHFAKKIIASASYTKVATLSMLRLDNVDINTDISDTLTVLAGFSMEDKSQFNWDDNEVFIVEHLEHNIKSYDANHTKLNVISFLISKKKRVVLISEVYPSQIFAFYENPPKDSNLPWGSFEDDFNSWRNILSAFPQVLIGITKNTKKVYQVLGIRPTDKPTRYERTIAPLIEELGHSKFLPTLAPIILSKTLYRTEGDMNQPQQLDRQRMVMHTQNLAHGYYNDIWNALPTRERYLLYDLAKDGFMNIKNRNSLFSLMKKGLVVWRDRPAIFNYSFKNFIITSVSLNEALRLENKNRGKGSWSNVRVLFYLVILTIIVFIVLGKPELLKDFEALIGTLGGLGVVIPLISKIMASGGRK